MYGAYSWRSYSGSGIVALAAWSPGVGIGALLAVFGVEGHILPILILPAFALSVVSSLEVALVIWSHLGEFGLGMQSGSSAKSARSFMNSVLLEASETTRLRGRLEVSTNIISATLHVLVGVEHIEESQVVVACRKTL